MSYSNSFWKSNVEAPMFSRLERDMDAEVAIIGGGITGVLTAFLLNRAGRKTVLLEALNLGAGTTGFTTAHFTQLPDTDITTLISKFSEEETTLAMKSLLQAINFVDELARQHNIQCDFRRLPAYLYTERESDIEDIRREYEASKTVGLDAELLYNIPLPMIDAKAAIKYNMQAHFHILKFLYSIAGIAAKEGLQIYNNSRVVEIEENDPYTLRTDSGATVRAQYVVHATHTPLLLNVLQMEMKVCRSYVLGARMQGFKFPDALFWDYDDPYHYMNKINDVKGELIMIGGGDHSQGDKANELDYLKKLDSWATKRFDISAVDYVWSGQEFVPPDGLPFIGKNPFSENSFIATGFSGNGISFGSVAAMLISDLILGKENPTTELYKPSRLKPIASFSNIMEENIYVAKHFIADRFQDTNGDMISHIQNGEGKIIELDGKKTAVYKSEEGEVYALSPVCSHAKCIVKWNEFEKTWDCPCHGARYFPTGEVLEGPAVKGLERIEVTVR